MIDATFHVQMNDNERALFERSLSNKPIYLEFGCGGSTEIAISMDCPMIVSVDSDREWIRKLNEKSNVAARVKNGTLLFDHIDIGPVGAWGVPKDDSKIRSWPKYCLAPFRRGIQYEYILVDGRFRVACACVAWAFMTDDALLAVHDYRFRPQYYEIEKFFELQEEVDTLVLLKKKKTVFTPSLMFSIMNNLFNYS